MWGLTSQPLRHSDKFWREICPNEAFTAPCTGQEQLISTNAASFTQISDRYSGFFNWGSYRGIPVIFLPWNVNLENYSSSLMTWRFGVTREEPEFFNRYSWFYHSILRDFETQDLRKVRVACREWLRYVICNMEAWLSHWRFCVLQTPFLV